MLFIKKRLYWHVYELISQFKSDLKLNQKTAYAFHIFTAFGLIKLSEKRLISPSFPVFLPSPLTWTNNALFLTKIIPNISCVPEIT